jgi:glutamate--cysteine ligase catalytic subunit
LPAVDVDIYEEMSMGEIFSGKSDYFPGLLPLVRSYLDFINCDSVTFSRINQYLELIEK